MLLSACRRIAVRHNNYHSSLSCFSQRNLTVLRGTDPLEILLKECVARNLCDADGNRLPDVHWVCAIALGGSVQQQENSNNSTKAAAAIAAAAAAAPNLRTVGIQRVVPQQGIDFILKASSRSAQQLAAGAALSLLHTQGHFLPGESAEQWRGEGRCVALDLTKKEDQKLLQIVPLHTLTSMLGSRRLQLEQQQQQQQQQQQNDQNKQVGDEVEEERTALKKQKSHLTELLQRTRLELEQGAVSPQELADTVQAFRWQPDRLECMRGGPDSVMWDRWEWTRKRQAAEDNNGLLLLLLFDDPRPLVPH